jgi:CBS domain-containing protein
MLEDSKLTAADVMSRDVVTVYPHTSLIYVAKLMVERRISGVPVVDEEGNLLGVISESDLVRWHDSDEEKREWWLHMLAEGFNLNPGFLDYVRSEQDKVRTVMHADPVTVTPETPVKDVAKVLIQHNIKRVPVLHDGRVVGIVSRADLVRALAAG